jgi:signal transduction histidine kinase
LEGLIRTLALASGAAIAAMTVAIALYVRRSLRPVLEIGQLADRISVRELDTARIQLQNAPSEVRQLAQTCNTMLDRLAQSWEQQRQFVSNVSHELRTPLTLVSGYLQSTLRRATNLSEPQREALEIAASEAERTIQLLQDLLDLARADRGYLHFQLEPLLIADLVAEVVEMAKQYSHREIAIVCGEDLLEASADRNRLKQVLLNLIDNAVKYSPSDTEIKVGVRSFGDRAIVEICDRGVGIPLAQQGRIFERFYRVDEARSRSVSPGESLATGGTGLGLSIVKTLVEGMGGTVTVRSKPGEGSTFGVILPKTKLTVRCPV